MLVIGVIGGIAAIIAFVSYIGSAAFSDKWSPSGHKPTGNSQMVSLCMHTFWISLLVAAVCCLLCLIIK